MSAFGSGCDIGIHEGAHNRGDNYSYLSNTYDIPADIINDKEKAQLYMTGSYSFKVKQLEVFTVTLKQ